MSDTSEIIKLADAYYEGCCALVKTAFVRKIKNKWHVLSHKGKSLGSYDTKAEAVARLKQIEYFKNHPKDSNSAEEVVIDLTDADDISYSAIMRKMRQKAPKEQVRVFLKLFKDQFDKAVKNNLQKPEKVALQNALVKFNKLHKIKVSKKLIKNAAIAELGEASEVGRYLANICGFILNRLAPESRAKAIESLRKKFYYTNADELSRKVSPPSAAIGQSITFVKHVLLNQEPQYIREVLNELSRNLK